MTSAPSGSPPSQDVLAELWAWIAHHSDDEIVAELPKIEKMSPDNLELLRDQAGPEDEVFPLECECGIVYRTECSCGCERLFPATCPTCGMEPDFAPGRNTGHYLSPRVLAAIESMLRSEPGVPAASTAVLSQDGRTAVLAKRFGKSGLWRSEDLIHEDHESPENERIERTIYTLSGWRAAGCPADVPQPQDNGHQIVGQARVLTVAPENPREHFARGNAVVVDRLLVEWRRMMARNGWDTGLPGPRLYNPKVA